jgi:hypothetical protein
VHVSHSNVGHRRPVPRDSNQAMRGVDSRATGAASECQFDGQPGPTGDIQKPHTGTDAEVLMHSDVLAAVSGFRQRRELRGAPPPAFVDAPLVLNVGFGHRSHLLRED